MIKFEKLPDKPKFGKFYIMSRRKKILSNLYGRVNIQVSFQTNNKINKNDK